jgi:hypothetical protein
MAAFALVGVEENELFERVNSQGFGAIVKDGNGEEKYVELRAIIHGNDVDADGNEMTARETLAFAAQDYAESVERKKREAEEKAREKEEKRKRDAEERERKKVAKKKESEEE